MEKLRRTRSLSLQVRLTPLLIAFLPACANHSTSGTGSDEPIPECEAFLVADEQCLDSLGPASVAHARVEQTRASFDVIHGEAARAALRQKCADNLAQIKTRCR